MVADYIFKENCGNLSFVNLGIKRKKEEKVKNDKEEKKEQQQKTETSRWKQIRQTLKTKIWRRRDGWHRISSKFRKLFNESLS